MNPREVLLDRLNVAVAQLLDMARSFQPDRTVSDEWTAKDVLGHVTFWHESFARNVADLAQGRTPTPLKGKLGDLNQRGVESSRACTLSEVIARFEAAHEVIRANILNPALTLIPLSQRLARLFVGRASRYCHQAS